MADDLETAVLFSFDQSGSVDATLKARAQAYCDSARASPDAWKLCLERLNTTAYVEVSGSVVQEACAVKLCVQTAAAHVPMPDAMSARVEGPSEASLPVMRAGIHAW